MRFRLNDVKNFLEVAQCRTMSEAAQKLGISQPALSESIKRLETDLQETLLYRTRAGVTLTPNGHEVHTKAKNAWTFLSEIEMIHEPTGRYGSRVITVGCHPLVASYCLPAALQRLQLKTPDYKINLRHDLSRSIQTEIQQGRIDLGIVVNPSPSPDIIIRKIGSDEFAVWTAQGGSEDRIFCNLELVQSQSILRKWKHPPLNRVDTDSLELIVRLTESGLGFGILPARAVHLLGARLRRVDSTPVFKDTISLLYRPEFGKSKVERELIDALTDSIAMSTT